MATDVELETSMVRHNRLVHNTIANLSQGIIVVELYNDHAPKVREEPNASLTTSANSVTDVQEFRNSGTTWLLQQCDRTPSNP